MLRRTVAELGQTARELAAALSRVCSRLDGGSVTASSADETGDRGVPETHVRRV